MEHRSLRFLALFPQCRFVFKFRRNPKLYSKLLLTFDLTWTLKFIRSCTLDKYDSNESDLNSQLSMCLLKTFFSLPHQFLIDFRLLI